MFYTGGQGGTGVLVSGASVTVNTGTITGGHGGISEYDNGGPGGFGVSLAGGAQVVNHGMIQGGVSGYYAFGDNAAGGTGAYLNGGTLVTSGTIAGGLPDVRHPGGTSGDAVQFGTLASTLVVGPGAVFSGAVLANSAAPDTLELAGLAAGTLTGFGTQITGFTTITEDAHARWTLTGTLSGAGTASIGAGAALTLNGAVSIAALAFASPAAGTLRLADPTHVSSTVHGFGTGDLIDVENIQATSLSYGHGTLTLYDSAHAAVDTLAFAGRLSPADFGLRADGHGGTDVTGNAFAPAGTAALDGRPAVGSPIGLQNFWHTRAF